MLPNISVGPLTFPTAGLILLVGVWLALTSIERAAKLLKLNADVIYSVSVVALASGFVGARLSFVVMHWSVYQSDLLGIIWPITSGYELAGGLVAGVLAGFFYGRYRGLSWPSTLDAVGPGIAVGLLAVSMADFFGGSGYGTETSLPWAINVFGIKRHPVQIYELSGGCLALVIWWRLRARRAFDGQLFLLTTAVYSGGRLFFDAFRANSWLTTSGYRGTQIVSLIILLVAVFLLGWQGRDQKETTGVGDDPAEPPHHQSAQ